MGLADRLDHKPSELSVGQQQRVALARMLANDPAVILADEPTGNLDPETSQQMIGFLEEVNAEGRTIVMVTHDPRAAERAKRVLKLDGGAIVSEKPREEPPVSGLMIGNSLLKWKVTCSRPTYPTAIDLIFRAFSDRTRLRILCPPTQKGSLRRRHC